MIVWTSFIHTKKNVWISFATRKSWLYPQAIDVVTLWLAIGKPAIQYLLATAKKMPQFAEWKTKYLLPEVTKTDEVATSSHFSSNKTEVHAVSDDSSSCVADPKPCHLILPRLSTRYMYLQFKSRATLYWQEKTTFSVYIKWPKRKELLLPSEKVYNLKLLPEVIMVPKSIDNMSLWIVRFPHHLEKCSSHRTQW